MQRAGDKKAIVWQIFLTCKVKKVKLVDMVKSFWQDDDYRSVEL